VAVWLVSWGYPASVTERPLLVVAHRAGNRLNDLRAALDLGVDLVEGDVHLFRGALEMRHCKAIGRHVFLEGWNEVDLRRNLVVPELADLLEVAAGDPRIMFDLKGPSLAVAPAVAAVLRQTAPDVPFAVCTKQWNMFPAFDVVPRVRRVFSASNKVQLALLRSRLRRQPAYGVSIRLGLLTSAIVAELRTRVGMVLAWSIDTEAGLARARRIGVDGVITKNPVFIRRLVAERDADPGALLPALA
jgi:glycerophosphoryl diester phosphodiesterase